MKKTQKLTRDDIWEMFAETDRRFKKTEQLIKENAKQFKENAKQFKENAKQFKENEKKMAKMNEETDKRMAKMNEETDQRMAKMNEETDQRMAKMNEENKQSNYELRQIIKELSREVGGIGRSNGELAEEFFYNAFFRDRTFVNEKFDFIKRNFTYRGEGDNLKAEYDIFLFNGKSAAIIEVKYNAKEENININKLISRVEVFKIWFPEYKNHNIYLGVAAMSFHKNIVWQLHRAGIATIRPIGKKMLVYDKMVKVF